MKFNRGTPAENPEPGMYDARLIKLIDIGTQHTQFMGEERVARKVLLTWELVGTKMTGKYKPELKGKPFAVTRNYKQSLHKKASLRQDLEGWRGRAFTDAEIEAFNPKNLLLSPCLLNIMLDEGGYIKVQSIVPVPKGKKIAKAINPPVFFSLDEGEFDPAVFATLGEKLKEKITASPEYAALTGDQGEPPQSEPQDEPQPQGEEEGPGGW